MPALIALPQNSTLVLSPHQEELQKLMQVYSPRRIPPPLR
jgi:hypothetical protein